MDGLDPAIKRKLKKEELRYAMDDRDGFIRQKFGRDFRYYDTDLKRISDKKTLERIEALGIPPAWTKVWISPQKNTHLQATGYDEKKRKQYIYHPDWIKISQENKFGKMVDFGLSLPKIRSKVRYDMSGTIMDKKKILATIVWLLEHTFIRIGNEQYSRGNESYGLTTLRNKHVQVRGDKVKFEFVGKSGVEAELSISNPTIAKTIRRCIELPGYELFQFIDDEGEKRVVDSEDVNEFLKEVTKEDFTAKDFRTWGASDLSANYFYKAGHSDDKKVLKATIKEAIKTVSGYLNNTVTVCRSYYIHPAVIKTYEENILVPHFGRHSGRKPAISGLSWDEVALVRLLQKYS